MPESQLLLELGYPFRQMELFGQALTHRSSTGSSNERLEFLGDAVLNLIVAGELYSRYPLLKEGELSRLRADLVNDESLARLAKKLKVGQYLKFGSGESKITRTRQSVLADAMEAIIGAIYLDSDFATAADCVVRWYRTFFKVANLATTLKKDPKSRLQEFLQMKKMPLPDYTLIETSGPPHNRVFKVSCKISLLKKTTLGAGSNKKIAQRRAAEKMLISLDKQKLLS